jgi:sterol desaturase/sphingolipid hydroxylase (fatty acid hydroxylase superfamily)
MKLTNWRISKWAYLADLFFVPAYAILALGIGYAYATPTAQWLGLFALGWCGWTLTEYWMHRELFHRFYRMEHGMHHRRPLDWIGVSPFLTAIAFAAVWLLSVWALDGVGKGGFLFAGYMAGYYAYITIHLMIHHTDWRIVARLRATHEMHHSGAERNFGVSTNLWDHVFRTYTAP